MAQKFYIKERHNPQFKQPYYVRMGQMLAIDAKKYEDLASYGTNYMLSYNTKEDYEKAISEFKQKGFSVH